MRQTCSALNSGAAEAENTSCLSGSPGGTVIGPTARQAMEKRDGSVARPTQPFTPPVSARET